LPFTSREVTLQQAKNNLGQFVTAAAHDQQVTAIIKYGIPAACIIPREMMPALTAPTFQGAIDILDTLDDPDGELPAPDGEAAS
jgi:prevent-host-death family protein